MHVSLTPELEKIVKEKVQTGLYNNASEVIREALRFMQTHDELVREMKLDRLRAKLAEGERDIEKGQFTELGKEDLGGLFQDIKNRALKKLDQESR